MIPSIVTLSSYSFNNKILKYSKINGNGVMGGHISPDRTKTARRRSHGDRTALNISVHAKIERLSLNAPSRNEFRQEP